MNLCLFITHGSLPAGNITALIYICSFWLEYQRAILKTFKTKTISFFMLKKKKKNQPLGQNKLLKKRSHQFMNGNRIHEESLLVSFDCEAVSREMEGWHFTPTNDTWTQDLFFGTAKISSHKSAKSLWVLQKTNRFIGNQLRHAAGDGRYENLLL